MNSMPRGEGLAVLYLGTHKMVALGGTLAEGEARVTAIRACKHPEGFEAGLVTDLERAAGSLESLVKEAGWPENASCVVLLGNPRLKTFAYSSAQHYQGFPRTITPAEIRAVAAQTRSVATLPLTEFVLQSVPESFLVNDSAGVRNPLGLEAHRLGVTLKMHTMPFQDFRNLSKAFEAAEIDVQGYFPKTLGVAEAVLTPQEREEGALVIDLAGDCATFILWKPLEGIQTRVCDLGSRVLDRGIAEAWGLEIRDAEKLKEQYGSLEARDFGEELIPLVERAAGTNPKIRRQAFHEKFAGQARAWLTEVFREADRFAADERALHPHVILTGGGAKADGLLEFLQRALGRAARLGQARQVEAGHEFLVDLSLAGPLGIFRWFAEHAGERRRFFEPHGILEKTFASARSWFLATF